MAKRAGMIAQGSPVSPMCRQLVRCNYWMSLLIVTCGFSRETVAQAQPDESNASRDRPAVTFVRDFVDRHCLECHNSEDRAAELSFDTVTPDNVDLDPHRWERVVRMLRARRMPPVGSPRPDEEDYKQVLSTLETALDSAATENPTPGRTDTFRRLNRIEYHHAIRDLLALDVDVNAMLPADEASHGFDNVTVGDLSPTLLNRYLGAAQKISHLAVGGSVNSPGGKTIRIPADVTQEERDGELPVGTRGGVMIPYNFPQDGEYVVQIRLARDRNEEVEGLKETHELELLIDLERVKSFRVKPPQGKGKTSDYLDHATHANVDQHLKARISVTAGPHQLGVAFIKNPSSLLETMRQPLNVHFNRYRHPRIGPAIYQVSVAGPFGATGHGNTPSRRRLFVAQPTSVDDEEVCAKQILATLMRRAYRRPIHEADFQVPMRMYHETSAERGFEAGIEMALSSILVNPHFLFRIELDPAGVAPNSAYRISDVELASRLSFFLWSSLPDDELLDLACRGQLANPKVLEAQTRRMLADNRCSSLVSNFARQWLYLRNLESSKPNARLFPDFDDNLRQAFRRETELFFESVIREDRSAVDLLKANYTYLNERLAKHYGIPHVYGSRFRRVPLGAESRRGGLLRHGSILTVTSFATRTSPVTRGKWILENILGMPPPPPPDNVPALKENTVAANLSGRERLAAHRANPACASCHDLIDPIGFSLENYDAVARWREVEEDKPVDASGRLPDGNQFTGVSGLEQGLLNRPDLFIGTMCEKLLTYALGRGVEHFDAPAVREIVRTAAADDYRFSSLIVGIAKSAPFQMRTAK